MESVGTIFLLENNRFSFIFLAVFPPHHICENGEIFMDFQVVENGGQTTFNRIFDESIPPFSTMTSFSKTFKMKYIANKRFSTGSVWFDL